MEAIPLSKRRPYMQKLGGKRLKNNFYEEKTFSNLLKKIELYCRVYIKLQDPIFFKKNHLAKIKKIFRLAGALAVIIFP